MDDADWSEATQCVLSYAKLMKDEGARKSLTEYARREASEENLLFFDAAREFHRARLSANGSTVLAPATVGESDDEELKSDADAIIQQYLRDDSPMALNLPSNILGRFKRTATIKYSPHMFDCAARVIYKAIEQDTFVRFKDSDLAATVLKTRDVAVRPSSETVESTDSFFRTPDEEAAMAA